MPQTQCHQSYTSNHHSRDLIVNERWYQALNFNFFIVIINIWLRVTVLFFRCSKVLAGRSRGTANQPHLNLMGRQFKRQLLEPTPGVNQNLKKQPENLNFRQPFRDFPGGPVVKTPCSQCRDPGFDLWSGNQIPHAVMKSPHGATKRFPHATTKDSACHN